MRFADTSYWVALQFRRDAHHAEAVALWTRRDKPSLTTNHVVGETWTFLRRRLGHGPALAFVEQIASSPRVSIRHVDDSLERDAWEWLRRHDEREYSFVDATSFALMRRLGLHEALAFDGDFAAAGFVEARP
jgi:predicted nucleic acid-binding protein